MRGITVRVLGLSLTVLVLGCTGATGEVVDAQKSSAQNPSPEPITHQVLLSFDEEEMTGNVQYAVEYGSGRRTLGFLPVCLTNSCASPCPCSTQIQPAAFDVDADKDLWILDVAKERVAKFDRDGNYLSQMGNAVLDQRVFDLQLVDDRPAVLSQSTAFNGRLAFPNVHSKMTQSVIRFDGKPVEAYPPLVPGTASVYLTLLVSSKEDEKSIPAQVGLADDERHLTATQVPGIPFLDGWLLYQEPVGEQTIPLAVTSNSESWSLQIEFLIKRKSEDNPIAGTISWETAIDREGVIHLLILAGTARKPLLSGYWYLKVFPDGRLSGPVALTGPSISDSQQSRRLALDSEGRPLIMWAKKHSVEIVGPPSL
jgi:hypothetical protein